MRKNKVLALLMIVCSLAWSGNKLCVWTKQEDLNQDLFNAIDNENINRIKRFLALNADVNARDSISWTPLMRASWKSNAEIVALLIGAKADVSMRSSISKCTALHLASMNGDRVVAQLLMVHAGCSLIDTATLISTHEITGNPVATMRLLIAAKAEIDAKNWTNETPLALALDHGNNAMATLLIMQGAHCGGSKTLINFAGNIIQPFLDAGLKNTKLPPMLLDIIKAYYLPMK